MEMNQNSRFSAVTSLDFSRSKFDRDFTYTTTGSVGAILPTFLEEVLPGDTFSVKSAKVIRMQTPITPIYDNIYCDTYYFFVPMRLVWEHTAEFFGENKTGAWIPTTTYQIPQCTAPSGGWQKGTIADYLGIPTNIDNISVNALPFRAYSLVCDQWFRSEVLTNPLYIPLGDATQTGSNGSNYLTDCANGGMPMTAAKYHDYFTSCLPAPQRSNDVTIGLTGNIPVVGNGYGLGLTADNTNFGIGTGFRSGSSNAEYTINFGSDTSSTAIGSAFTSANPVPGNLRTIGLTTDADKSGILGDLSGVTGISINALRIAFQTQKYYEKLARSGGRFTSMLKAMYGVTSPDARIQRTEYLGGSRTPVNIMQVLNNAETTTSPLGNTGAYSLTNDTNDDFHKSFTEFGYVIGLTVFRYNHSYQNGLDRLWSRKDPLDFYNPTFANIGETPVLVKEIYCTGTSADNDVFGFQEAWADYRYHKNMITSEMRSNYAQSLDTWHLGDDYTSQPYLSDSWIREDPNNVDRVLSVAHTVSDQFFMNILYKNECTRVMPLYSIPGLIDHN